jgi:hypothetical protein
MPQHVHLCSQYSSGPHVLAPHVTGARIGAAVAASGDATPTSFDFTACGAPHAASKTTIEIAHPRITRS